MIWLRKNLPLRGNAFRRWRGQRHPMPLLVFGDANGAGADARCYSLRNFLVSPSSQSTDRALVRPQSRSRGRTDQAIRIVHRSPVSITARKPVPALCRVEPEAGYCATGSLALRIAR
jgi:hypothetical protein